MNKAFLCLASAFTIPPNLWSSTETLRCLTAVYVLCRKSGYLDDGGTSDSLEDFHVQRQSLFPEVFRIINRTQRDCEVTIGSETVPNNTDIFKTHGCHFETTLINSYPAVMIPPENSR